ncbi:hypothetical protein LTR70_000992 [Exophiala xenobiotica]|uniref:NRPS-like protein biosynthetic cluster n=1 Tax=Lithohypha guttulata TaxID=1690604 RepID=A0ABR0K224_9EURO|nr:putative NRPS-like protein biosynthetic cluster [Lithohypha guttulata]KAK5329155.1 hypothetical protein LTR70_000992 [Exophiala xenobiotica]
MESRRGLGSSIELEDDGTPRSTVETLASTTDSPLNHDTPATDASIDQKDLPNKAPRRKLSYSSGTGVKQPPLSLLKGPDWPDVIPSIWESFLEAATKFPENLAVASASQKGALYSLHNLPLNHELYEADPYVRWSYAEFVKGVTRLIEALKKQGVGEGFPIFTFVYNCAEFLLIFWAAASLGCSIIPIHPRNLLNKEEATHIISHAILASPVENAIVFAQTAELAKQVIDLKVLYKTFVVVIDSNGNDNEPCSMHNFIAEGQPGDIATLAGYRESASNWSLIIFTSGSTALPKGVVEKAARFDRWIEARKQVLPVVPGDSCFFALPPNHAFYTMSQLSYHCCGAALVIPGPSFSPQSAPELFELEKCTDLPTSPTMVYALAQVAKERELKFSTLKGITCGGAKLSRETVKQCLEDIGSKSIEIAYASTESGPITSTGRISTVNELDRDGDITVGRPAMGGSVKICASGETTPLPLNTEGELHFTSATMCDGYVGGHLPSTFYTDQDGQVWMATGDAAMINSEGLVFIVGRVKDMIIRGGVNISPAAIEFVLATDSTTKDFDIQIVGRADDIAGEVPIAVSAKSVTHADVDAIQDVVLRHMGPVFLPEEVLTLEQIGLMDFPKTMLGKAQKAKLKRTVEDFIDKRDAPQRDDTVPVDELTAIVQKIWTRTIGHTVDIDAQVADYADSITIMRVRDRFAKEIGAPISLSDMLNKRTARDHIDLIRVQKQKVAQGSGTPTFTRSPAPTPGALTHRDIVHLATNPHHYSATQAHVSKEIGKVGLAWEDIQAITPASDFNQVLTQADILNASWTFKFAFLARPGINKQAVRRAVEVTLSNNPMLASSLLWNKPVLGSDIALHIMFKHNKKLFDRTFRDYGSIATKADFANLVYKPYEYEMAMLPGLLTQFLLFDVAETGQSGTIMVAHHASYDASYMQLVFDDLDKALGGATTLDPHIPYKAWADSFYCLRTSHEAQTAVDWHLSRLSNLSNQRSSVFPPLPRPHHYTTQSQHIQDVSDNGYHTNFHVPGITTLKWRHPNLNNPMIIKSAWSLLNMHRNGTSTALFSNTQANRKRFPFIPVALESLAPPDTFSATRVAGSTLQDVVNIIPVHHGETVIQFMTCVTADQDDLTTYAAAPLTTILQKIGPINAEVMLDVLRSQIFNWVPGLGAMQIANPHGNYELLDSFIRPNIRLVINVDVGGHDDETVYVQIKSPLYDLDGHKGIARDFQDLVLWLCNEENWGKEMGEYKNALRETSAGGENDGIMK